MYGNVTMKPPKQLIYANKMFLKFFFKGHVPEFGLLSIIRVQHRGLMGGV
jgi:hypothetical protein